MEITRINDIPVNEYPVFESMLSSTLVRFSKWECAKHWEKRGLSFFDAMNIYDKHIKKVNNLIQTINKAI